MSLLLLLLLLQDPPVPLKNGRYRGDIVDPATKEVIMKVRMQVPDKLPAEKTLGFIFVCHGFRGHENNSYLDGTVAALKRKGIDGQYLVVAGKSKGDGWAEEDDDRFLKLYAWAKQNYPVDPKRLFLFGSSNGARFVNRFGAAHQDIVNGVVSYCGSYDLSKMPEPAEKKTEWYYVHGGKDNPQNSRRMCDELKKRGYRYVFRMLDGYGHTDIWDGKGHPDTSVVEAVCDDWAEWLHHLPRKSHDPADLKALERMARWRQPGAQDALCAKAKSRDLASIEALVPGARLALLGNPEDPVVIETLIGLLADEDAKIAAAAFKGLQGAVADNFGYAPEAALDQRKEAAGKWQAWWAGRSAK